MVWFDPEMAWFAVPCGKAGPPGRFVSGSHTAVLLEQGAVRTAVAANRAMLRHWFKEL